MAKTYGGRWQISSSLASGGQAEVFKVRDIQGEHSAELVLKRVRNPKRHDRFRAEVEAIKRLNHPNVIQLIDHSALTTNDVVPDQQFIVMPYASQGDLSSRVPLYTNNLDSVVKVAKSLALGLRAAHTAGIIHRDVKPQNILFPTVTHDVWLSDFGICLIRDQDRATPADEIVGPAQFMAPELEGGGQLGVSPAADIYSLGKVMYYMLSGGVVIPRERLHEPEYSKVFRGGERHNLLETLLSRMICDLSNRFTSMDDVLRNLERIENWEHEARLLPIEPKTMLAIDAMKRKALEVQRQTDMNADIRTRRDVAMTTTSSGALNWFRTEFEKTAALFNDGHAISARVLMLEVGQNNSPPLNDFQAGPAVELRVQNKYETFQKEHLLRMSIYTKSAIIVTSRIITGREPSMQVPTHEEEHVKLMLVPSYGRATQGAELNRTINWKFFTDDGSLYSPEVKQNQLHPKRVLHGVRQQPQQPVKVHAIQFSTADWPSIADRFSVILQQTVDTFVSAMNVASGPVG
jgi:serine/threonine protein kinase